MSTYVLDQERGFTLYSSIQTTMFWSNLGCFLYLSQYQLIETTFMSQNVGSALQLTH